MGTNGGLTYHVHGSEYSSPADYVTKMTDKYDMSAEYSPLREVQHCLCQTLSYFILVLVICSFGFLTGLEVLTYPLLIRKLTCVKDWDLIQQSIIPTSPLFANMVGSIVGGFAIDKLGRRPVFVVASFLAIIAEITSMVSMETTLYIVSRSFSSLTMGTLYITTLLYCIETVPVQHRLHSYLLHYLAQSAAVTLLPLTLTNSPFDGTRNSWLTISAVSVVVLGVGIVVGILYPEPTQSAKIRLDSDKQFQSKWSVIQLDNKDVLEPEPDLALYSDMFYEGGKVVATLLIILSYMGGLMTTSIYMTFPILSNAGSACPYIPGRNPKPCMDPGTPDSTTSNEMMIVLGCSVLGSLLAYIFVQRYGRKNSYRGPAAFRVIVVISMVLCATHSFMLTQAGFVVIFTSIMDFTLDLYSLELYAVRSRATAFGLLMGMKMFGIATYFLVNPLILSYVSPDMKFSVVTVIGTLVFGCSLGLRKETFNMALNIEEATVDVGL